MKTVRKWKWKMAGDDLWNYLGVEGASQWAVRWVGDEIVRPNNKQSRQP